MASLRFILMFLFDFDEELNGDEMNVNGIRELILTILRMNKIVIRLND